MLLALVLACRPPSADDAVAAGPPTSAMQALGPDRASLVHRAGLGLEPPRAAGTPTLPGGPLRRAHVPPGWLTPPDAPPGSLSEGDGREPMDAVPTSDLLGTVRDARAEHDIGGDLDARLAEEDEDDVAAWGPSLLTYEELTGTEAAGYADRLCVEPEYTFSFDEDGVGYDARFQTPTYTDVVFDVVPWRVEITSACAAALDGGDPADAVTAGDCTPSEEATFFAEGSGCRQCLDAGGAFDACEAEGSCASVDDGRVVSEDEDGVSHTYDWMYSYVWACAPEWLQLAYFLVDAEDDGSAPPYFSHERWNYVCLAWWEDDWGGPYWYCLDGEGGPTKGATLAKGSLGMVKYIRPAGTDGDDWVDRLYVVDEVRFSGATLESFWAWNPGTGAVSVPLEYADTDGDGEIGVGDTAFGYTTSYAFGLDPTQTRPDGESQARDWIAAVVLKASTTESGITISVANHNRCDAWVDAGDGTSHCETLGPPDAGWLNDVESWSTDGVTYRTPVTTLASTGLPDPAVPGGYVIDVASAPALADPEWEDCAHPDTFVPDTARMERLPGEFGTPGGLVGETWRFGREDHDFRVVLNTNETRGYCPGGSGPL